MVEETVENYWLAAIHCQTLSYKIICSKLCLWTGIKLTTLEVIDTNWIGRCIIIKLPVWSHDHYQNHNGICPINNVDI